MTTLTQIRISRASKKVYDYVLSDLRDRLPAHVTYHNPSHTDDVIDSCKRYLTIYDISSKDENLLIMAAAGHDYGFVVSPENHEETSAKMMSELMKKNGFRAHDIKVVKGLIMATKLPQSPKTFLEEIIADADLDYLGRNDYDEISDRLFQELKYFAKINTQRQWLELQIGFLEKHTYHTSWAKENREPEKQGKITDLKRKLEDHLKELD